MAINYTPISPEDNDTNVSLKAEVVLNIVNTLGPVDTASLDVDVTFDAVTVRAIENGSFINSYSGELIDNLGDGTDITVVIIRPVSDPQWSEGKNVEIDVNSGASIYSFDTESFRFIAPETYTEDNDLTVLPVGYALQSSGGGSSPSFGGSGMTTSPGGGTSFIENTSAGLDFDQGILIDVEVHGDTGTFNPQTVLQVD